jgi:DNA sulfur modification protein DndD
MKLLWWRANNFRVFIGETPKIEFAQDDEKNVTVIIGSNGVGKTTLLNSLTWLFYGQFTDAFDLPDRLVNNRAIAIANPGATVSCWVEVTFEHNGRKYHLKRTKNIRRGDTSQVWTDEGEDLALESAGPDGKWNPINKSDIPDTIGRILPEQLHRYFFFDGERIEKLQRPDKKNEIVSAITMLIGEAVLNRSVDDLSLSYKKLEKELKSIGDEKLAALIDEAEKNESEQQRLVAKQAQHASNLEGYRKRKQAIEQTLLDIQESKILQEQREQLESEEVNITNALSSSRTTLAEQVSTRGYLPFLKGAADTAKQIISDLYIKGDLPCALKAPFVNKLLDQKFCICERELLPESAPYKAVENWRQIAGLSEIEETTIRLEGHIDHVYQEIPSFYEQIDREQKLIESNRDRLARVENQLAKIREKNKTSSKEDVRECEDQLEKTNRSIEETLFLMATEQKEINRLEDLINHLREQVRQLESKNAQQDLSRRRLAVCNEAIKVLQEVQRRQRVYFRADLSERINKLFSKISFKPYIASLSPEYTLCLNEPGGTPVGSSTGEKQVLSLAFLGAIIEQSREFTAKKEGLPGPESSTFPVCMDSSFGSLDPLYRRQVTTLMPDLANQFIIILSRSQLQVDVEQSVRSRVGKEYVLSCFTPKPDADEDSILLNGRKYDLVKRCADDLERSEVVEVIR